jgi:predicted small lipoprotein YifL
MKTALRLFAATASLAILAGCGNKGPLVHPTPADETAVPVETVPAPASTTTPADATLPVPASTAPAAPAEVVPPPTEDGGG